MNYIHHTGWHFTVLYLVFRIAEGAPEFNVAFSLAFSRAKGKPQRPIRAKKDIYCLDTAEFIGRVYSLRRMSKDDSKYHVGNAYGKLSLKVPPKTTVDSCNGFK